MASTNKTPNIELSQFVGTDKPAWLTDYNSDMSKIDTAVKANETATGNVADDVATLSGRMTTAEGNISDLQTGETSQNNRLTTLEGNYDTIHHEYVLLDEKVTQVETTANNASTTANAASTAAGNAQTTANAAAAAAQAAATSVQAITPRITAIENELDSFGNATGYDIAFDSQTNELSITTHTPTP